MRTSLFENPLVITAAIVAAIGVTSYMSHKDAESRETLQSNAETSASTPKLYPGEPVNDNAAHWTKNPLEIEPGQRYARFVSQAKGVLELAPTLNSLALYDEPRGQVIATLQVSEDRQVRLQQTHLNKSSNPRLDAILELGLNFEQTQVKSTEEGQGESTKSNLEIPFYERKIFGSDQGVQTWLKVGSPQGTGYYWVEKTESTLPLTFEERGKFINWPSEGSVLCASLTQKCLVVDERMEELFGEVALKTARLNMHLSVDLEEPLPGATKEDWQSYEQKDLLLTKSEKTAAHTYQYVQRGLPNITGIVENVISGLPPATRELKSQELLAQGVAQPDFVAFELAVENLSIALKEHSLADTFYMRTRNFYDSPETFR